MGVARRFEEPILRRTAQDIIDRGCQTDTVADGRINRPHARACTPLRWCKTYCRCGPGERTTVSQQLQSRRCIASLLPQGYAAVCPTGDAQTGLTIPLSPIFPPSFVSAAQAFVQSGKFFG